MGCWGPEVQAECPIVEGPGRACSSQQSTAKGECQVSTWGVPTLRRCGYVTESWAQHTKVCPRGLAAGLQVSHSVETWPQRG